MFGSIGMQELIIIFVIALIIFGPRKLPELGKSLGKSIAEFKRASNELRNTLEDEIRVEEQNGEAGGRARWPRQRRPRPRCHARGGPPRRPDGGRRGGPRRTRRGPTTDTTAPAGEPGDTPAQQG